MSSMYVLFEHASGYALFRAKEYEEVSMLTPQVEQAMLELTRFRSVIQLVAFSPFKNAANALDNMNSISEGVVHEDLQLFLETNLPKSSKKNQVVLGVADQKIAVALQDVVAATCQFSGVVPEIIRGIRMHFHHMVKGLTQQSASKAQLGLSHSYSRAKVKFNVNRVDNMIIQSISLLDQLDKDINTFSMRIREWYSYHFPELVKLVPDNFTYAQAVKIIKNRKELTEDAVEKLEAVVMDSSKAQAIVEAARSSMGMDISPLDLMNIEMFAGRVISLSQYRKSNTEYLSEKMKAVAPNLSTLIGDTVGARLISHAGSLLNLAKCPASTVQILGAEKALFRALKTRGNTPKYGLIFHSTFIGRAGPRNKGRISRYLANKCTIASRIDCFADVPTTVFGMKLKEQVEERLLFYETGSIPRKNLDVMKEALVQYLVVKAEERKKKKKLKKEMKKQKLLAIEQAAANETAMANDVVVNGEAETPKKKKKKDKKVDEEDGAVTENSMVAMEDGDEGSAKKKKKKKQKEAQQEEEPLNEHQQDNEEATPIKKKKKKHKELEEELNNHQMVEQNDEAASPIKKKKNKKRKRDEEAEDGEAMSFNTTSIEEAVAETPIKKPKKKKRKVDE